MSRDYCSEDVLQKNENNIEYICLKVCICSDVIVLRILI
jgi:hypothetical protein